ASTNRAERRWAPIIASAAVSRQVANRTRRVMVPRVATLMSCSSLGGGAGLLFVLGRALGGHLAGAKHRGRRLELTGQHDLAAFGKGVGQHVVVDDLEA